jgi:hypothetical protein
MFLVGAIASATVVHAEVSSQSKEIVVMQPKDLPEVAQVEGQSMELRALSNGKVYLYIEQQQLSRLVILDVTEPGSIKPVTLARMEIPVAFDFARPLGESAVLVCFRDRSGSAVLDLRKPKEPTLSPASTLLQGTHTEGIGADGFLMLNGARTSIDVPVQDYRVVDSTNPQVPRVLDTVEKVQQRLVHEEMGTTYLPGANGLTVVRQPQVEDLHRSQSNFTN